MSSQVCISIRVESVTSYLLAQPTMTVHCKTQCADVAGLYTVSTPDGLRRGGAVGRLVRLWVRILPRARKSVFSDPFVFSG
jgi:hypothetical protein